MLNLLERIPIALFVIGMDHKIAHWNKTCEQLTGFLAKEMIGTDRQWMPFYPEKRPVLADLIVDNDFTEIQKIYLNQRAAPSDVISNAWEARDYFDNIGGKHRHIYFLAVPVMDSEGNKMGAIETLQDITKQVTAEDRLRESEHRYRILSENIADGVALVQDGKLQFVNNAFAHMFGYDASQELLEQEAIGFISDLDKARYEKMERSFREKQYTDTLLELSCCRKDGSEFYIESHNAVVDWKGEPALLATVRDITTHKLEVLASQKKASELKRKNKRLRSTIKHQFGLGALVGKSKPMQGVYDNILKASSSDANAIIYGESGTGKELVARAIHDMSERATKPFIVVNCGAIPENLLESEFFGYRKGAFTGATIDKRGYIESARSGSLFLDEIGDLPFGMQVKLLRAIEGHGFTPIGSTEVLKADIRIISATNRDLKNHVKKGLMREDFFYRIHIIPIHLPPLRARKEDLSLLVYHFLHELGKGKPSTFMPNHVLQALQAYNWPGNVRELQNVIHRYVTFNKIDFLYTPSKESETPEMLQAVPTVNKDKHYHLCTILADFEKSLLEQALKNENGNISQVARTFGIERRSLQRKLKRLNLA